ncbi:uncharacterized protein LOC113305596 [Papaver somniferum]|uniref:uncharacterized protein LOC113305596 n=1 Tax=Papaver somniferum TaxID=3469 RepID=UPI000E6F5262|nr:uncharacterized protein LOC113305596 [Papaver somniferum]
MVAGNGGNRSWESIIKKRTHVLYKIDADSLSHPPVRTSTGEVIITISRETHVRIKDVWKFSLVGRLDFRTLKFDVVKRELLNQWKLGGSVQFIPWIKGYLVIKLDNEDDRKRVSYDGPWKINEQQLKIQPWMPMFDSESDKVTRDAVWVRFPALPWEYWDEESLFRMSRGLGKPCAVDPRTLNYEYGYFAAVLIDIDFSKPLGKIIMNGEDGEESFVQNYEILNRPSFCDHCISIGNINVECRIKKRRDLQEKVDAEKDPEIKNRIEAEIAEL